MSLTCRLYFFLPLLCCFCKKKSLLPCDFRDTDRYFWLYLLKVHVHGLGGPRQCRNQTQDPGSAVYRPPVGRSCDCNSWPSCSVWVSHLLLFLLPPLSEWRHTALGWLRPWGRGKIIFTLKQTNKYVVYYIKSIFLLKVSFGVHSYAVSVCEMKILLQSSRQWFSSLWLHTEQFLSSLGLGYTIQLWV